MQQWTQEIRLGSTGRRSVPVGDSVGSTPNVNRKYSNSACRLRAMTPITDVRAGWRDFGGGAANGFPLNSPYNADLPYDITQKAIFGEATYAVSDKLKVTAGGRLYDFKEARSFKSGGLFSNGDNRRDQTKSDGFTPRLLASFEASENVTLNAQASKGFRFGRCQ